MTNAGIDYSAPPFWPVGQYQSKATISAALTAFAGQIGLAKYLDGTWADREKFQAYSNKARLSAFTAEMRLRGVR